MTPTLPDVAAMTRLSPANLESIMNSPFRLPAPMYANNPAKLDKAALWHLDALPLIRALFDLEDVAERADTAKHRADEAGNRMAAANARELSGIAYRATKEVRHEIETTRDEVISDLEVGVQDDDAAQDAADDFNGELQSAAPAVDVVIRRFARDELSPAERAAWEAFQ